MRKKVDKTVGFLLTFLLVVGILLIYANLKFTGFATHVDSITNEADCIAANYTWENLTELNCTDILNCECINDVCKGCEDIIIGQGCSNLNYTNEADCTGNGSVWEDITELNCTDILDCECIDDVCKNCIEVVSGRCVGDICGDGEIQSPNDNGINEVCDDGSNNGEYDYCAVDCLSEGSYCGDGDCNSDDEDCDSCEDDCVCGSGYTCEDGNCVEEVEEEETSSSDSSSSSSSESLSSSDGSSMSGSIIQESSCTSNWECGEWTECIDGAQDRICTDINQCGSNDGMPETSQSCVAEIKENCSDGIKNQNETGIDCGGPCEKKCGFFTIVGSAVSGPIDAGKNFVFKGMFGNTTKTIISVASLVLVIGGVIFIVLFKKGILKFPINNPIQNKEQNSGNIKTF